MDLEEPRDALCPLCRGLSGCDDHRVTIKENKSGAPYFHCEQHKYPVNMNGGDVSEAALMESIETLEAAEAETDESSDDKPTIEDLFNRETTND